jgi:hypothetical protein
MRRGYLGVHFAIGAGLLALVALVFSQVSDFGFINFDDTSYVAANPVVLRGLTWRGVAWAFTTFETGNWHPLTWLSLMADVEVFEGGPRVHHLVNLALHAANTLLLFGLLAGVTGQRWRSALVAVLFAVHPLHVESVAWISERKDLLSIFFGLLGIGAYLRYTRARSLGWYALAVAGMVLSVSSKPMLVTLPAVFLLFDLWPLARSESWRALLLEKVPFLAISAASSLVTVVAQTRGGAVSTLDAIPLTARLSNAVVSYGNYLVKAIWPTALAVVYPHPALTSDPTPPAVVALWAVVLVCISITVAVRRSRWPFLFFGWTWFVVTLLPVIGLVQVGMQAMADRYTYFPLVGIFVAATWSLPDLKNRAARVALGFACAAVVLGTALVARVQTSYWRDSQTLFGHALAVTHDNATALRNLGIAYVEDRDYGRGIAALRESLRIVPGDAWAWMNLGIALSTAGDQAGAGRAFRDALRLRPDDADVLYNVGMFAVMQRNVELAHAIHARLAAVNPALADEFARRSGLR